MGRFDALHLLVQAPSTASASHLDLGAPIMNRLPTALRAIRGRAVSPLAGVQSHLTASTSSQLSSFSSSASIWTPTSSLFNCRRRRHRHRHQPHSVFNALLKDDCLASVLGRRLTSSSSTPPSTSTTSTTSTASLSSGAGIGVCIPPPAIAHAVSELALISEMKQAAETLDASLRHTLVTRVFDILRKSGSAAHAVVGDLLLARHYNQIGDVHGERAHRVDVLTKLSQGEMIDTETETDPSFVACMHAMLALCCLRGRGDEMTLAATTAAMNVERYATDSQMRLCGTLLNGMAAEKVSAKRSMLLSALTAVAQGENSDEGESESEDEEKGSKYPDVCGYARYLLAANEHEGYETRKDHALALVVRWDNREGEGERGNEGEMGMDMDVGVIISKRNELIEALLLASRVLLEQHGEKNHHDTSTGTDQDKTAFDHAEDLLVRALAETNKSSFPTDKVPVLLALARMHARGERAEPVQAEGFFRAAYDAMEPMWKRKAFTVAAAEVYERVLVEYGRFLETMSVDGWKRTTEVDAMWKRADEVRALYPDILGESEGESERAVDIWMVDALSHYFDVKLPF